MRNSIDPVALGDVTGDGRPDLVVNEGDRPRVAKGRGDGTFDPPPAEYASSQNGPVEIADMNGDGIGDIVSARGRTLTIELSNGDGTFATPIQADLSFRVLSMALEDMNGDGHRDVIAQSDSYAGIYVMLGSDTGLGPEIQYASEVRTERFAVGDLSGDGRPEVAIVTLSPPRLHVLSNNGTGALGAPVAVATVGTPNDVEIVDLNRDGRRDVVVAGADSASVVGVHLNQGSGSLGAFVRYEVSPRLDWPSIRVADFNGDNNPDVVVVVGDSLLAILHGSNTGALRPPIRYLQDSYARGVLVADVNVDGHPDVAVLEPYRVSVHLHDAGTNSFPMRTVYSYEATGQILAVQLEDLNNDGRPDLIATGGTAATEGVIVTRLADVNGGFVSSTTNYDVARYPNALIRLDANNDGRVDLVALTSVVFGGQALLNGGNGALVPAAPFTLTGIPRLHATGDVDRDGAMDLVVATQIAAIGIEVNAVEFVRGNGDGTFAAGVTVWTGERLHGVALGDIDSDGSLDLLIEDITSTRSGLQVLRGLGTGAFAPPDVEDDGNIGRIALRDLDGDSHLDLIEVRAGLRIRRGRGDGTFEPRVDVAAGNDLEPTFSDVNGDGKLDLLLSNYPSQHNSFTLALGNGDATLGPMHRYDVGPHARTLAIGDINADGRLDVVADDFDQATVLMGSCRPAAP
jgi:hypothetical protein